MRKNKIFEFPNGDVDVEITPEGVTFEAYNDVYGPPTISLSYYDLCSLISEIEKVRKVRKDGQSKLPLNVSEVC